MQLMALMPSTPITTLPDRETSVKRRSLIENHGEGNHLVKVEPSLVRRRWVIQEAALAKTVRFHSGSYTLDWDTFSYTLAVLRHLSDLSPLLACPWR